MITFSPRFRSQSPAHNGGPGGMLSYGDTETLRGLAGNDPRNTLLMNANDTNIDTALKNLLWGGSQTPINRAWMESHYLNGQDLESLLSTREGIRKGTAQAYFGPDGKLAVRRQGEQGWTGAAPEGSIGIGADGAGFNPLTSGGIPGFTQQNAGPMTHDMIRDPITGIAVSRNQHTNIQAKYGGPIRRGNRTQQAVPKLSYAPFRAPQAGRGGRTT